MVAKSHSKGIDGVEEEDGRVFGGHVQSLRACVTGTRSWPKHMALLEVLSKAALAKGTRDDREPRKRC